MRKRISTIIFVIIFLIGLSILLYPAVSEYVNERHSSRAIASYDKLVEELPEADYSNNIQEKLAPIRRKAETGILLANFLMSEIRDGRKVDYMKGYVEIVTSL